MTSPHQDLPYSLIRHHGYLADGKDTVPTSCPEKTLSDQSSLSRPSALLMLLMMPLFTAGHWSRTQKYTLMLPRRLVPSTGMQTGGNFWKMLP